MLFIAFAGVIVGLLIFIYFNRYMQNKRDARRENLRERKEQFLQQLLDMKKKQQKDRT